MDPADVLQAFDLTGTEATVYLTLLRNGPGTATAVAKQASVHRRLAYDVVESLTEKGLLSYVDEEQRRVYKPVTPERLHELVAERRADLQELEAQVDAVLPELMAQYEADREEREVKVLQGKEGIKQLFNDELREGEPIHVIGSPAESEEVLEYFLPSWTQKREEQEIMLKGIFEHEMRGMVGEHEPIECRFLPEEHRQTTSIAVYGNKIGITFWIDDPLVVMIRDADAAESFLSYFDLVWAAAEP